MTASAALGFLASPRFYDVVLVLLVLELVALGVFRLVTSRGVALPELLTFLGAGGALFVALRTLAGDGDPAWVAAALVVALACHALHLRQRWRR